MPDINPNLKCTTAQVSADQSFQPPITTSYDPRSRIKALAFANGIPLDIEAESKDRGHCVRQVKKHRGRYYTDEAKVIRDCSRDDERNRPPDWNDTCIEYLPLAGRERWRAEDIDHDIVVKYLDPDITIQSCGDEGRDQGDHVTCGLPAVDTNSLVAWGEAVLALEVVNVASVDKIDSVDEELGSPHGFDKISRTSHFS